jgi:hypothetical protein
MKFIPFRNLLSKSSVAVALVASIVGSFTVYAADEAYTYNMHLYFSNTQHYEDELTVTFEDNGSVTGRLHVPNDFDANIENALLNDRGELSFHVSLPAKYEQMFPGGMDYRLKFPSIDACPRISFCREFYEKDKFVGFIYPPTQSKHIGSVVGFAKASNP